jgi:hypothetical protein
MNDTESRLADALAARANAVEPEDERDALDRINRRLNGNRRRALVVLGVAAVLMLVVGAVALLRRDDGDKQTVGITATTAPVSTTATTTAAPPATVIPTDPNPAIWPFDSMNRTFSTPQEAAKSFAVDYLGMTFARVGKVSSASGEVEIFPNDRGNARTVVQVEDRQSHGWVVTGAKADQIQVDTPKPHDVITDPLGISGRSVAFEAQVGIELRRSGSKTAIAHDFAMGGSTELQPFAKKIAPPSTDPPLVLILFEGDASGEQTYTKATVIPLDAPR